MEKTERGANVLYGFWAKTAAVFISVLLVPLLLFYAVVFSLAYSSGMDARPEQRFEDSDFAKNVAISLTWEVIDYYQRFGADLLGTFYPADNSGSSYRFVLRSGDDIIYDNHSSGDTFIISYAADGLAVDSYFSPHVASADRIFRTHQLFDIAKASYSTSLIALPSGVIAEILLLVYLAWAAGRRRDGELCASWQEKLPFDVYTAAAAAIVICCCAAAFACLDSAVDEPIALAAAVLCAACIWLVFLGFWMTLCARIKLGGLFKNTLVFILARALLKLLRAAVRGVCSVVRRIPLIWKTILIFWMLAFFDICLSGGLLLLYIILLFILACWFSLQLRALQKAGNAIAQGDLSVSVDTRHMFGTLREHGEALNAIGSGMSIAVEQKLRSERLKTELITNVSHDIKTPLTSIVNYVDLLKKDHTPEQEAEYIDVLCRQSKRLKKLTEDLLELSKASTGNIACHPSVTNAAELIEQTVGEYSDRLAAAGLEPVVTVPEKPVFCMADGAMMWRVIDNLLSNACKYAQPATRIYISVRSEGSNAVFTFKNVSREPLNISAEELMERFVRGDSSRSTEGSGLGLNIASSLMSLQKGRLALYIDGDLFKAELELPLCSEPESRGAAGLY